jgi:peroxiredoxin
VLLVFWKSWSTPCIRELRRLQRLHDQTGQQGPVILAINDGEDPRRIAEIRREHEFTFKLIADPRRRISRRYGVHCWPTTVSIDACGLVERVHFGMTHDESFTSANQPRAK